MTGLKTKIAQSSLSICLVATACAVEHRPKSQYAGQLTSSTPSCHETRGTLIIQKDVAVFAPDDGTWIVEGKIDGSLIDISRTHPSFDHKVFSTELKATVTNTRIVGTYATPTCTYAVDLTRF